MRKLNVIVIAGLLALAAVLGTVAATRTVSLGASARQTSAAPCRRARSSSTRSRPRCTARSTRKPPALPAVPRRPPRPRRRASSTTGRRRSSSSSTPTTATTAATSTRAAAAMTSHAGRLYVLALALVVFFLAWATLSAHPWGAPRSDPRLAALTAREARLRHEAKLVDQVVARALGDLRRRPEAPPRADRVGAEGAAARPGRPDREPAAADDHEDVVIARRAFRAMGTEIELLVEAATTGDARARRRRGRVPPARGAALALPRGLRAVAAEPRRLARRRPRPRPRARARARRARADRRPLRPDGPRRLVAAGYDRSFELLEPESGERPRPAEAAAGRVRTDGARIELEPGVRVDLGGIAKGYAAERAAELLALAGQVPRQRRRRRGDPRRPLAGRRRDGGRPLTLELSSGGLATSGRDRRHWRRGGRRAAPPDRPAHRRAGRDRPAARDRDRRRRGRGGGRGEDALPRGRRARRRRGRRDGIAPCS